MRKMIITTVSSLFLSITTVAQSAQVATYTSEGQAFSVQVLTDQEAVIWGFDFLKDGRILFTEKSGAMKVLDPKTKVVVTLQGVPRVDDDGQGGLLDVRVHPTDSDRIFFAYSEPVGGNKATTSLATAILKGSSLTEFRRLFQAFEANKNTQHFGSRIEFGEGDTLFMSVGDRGKRKQSQSLSHHMGSILRLKEDGSVPSDNPFVDKKNAKPEIWSYGHRNPQGLVRHPETGDLWSSEMGPRGGDELNLIKRGANYGWPEVTYGREYYGPKIGKPAKAGMVQPIAHWVPSISPSAMTFYTGKRFPKWQSNAMLANLSGQHLRRLVIENGKVVKQEALLEDLGWRFRNVRPHDGYLYISTDDGKLARLVPVASTQKAK